MFGYVIPNHTALSPEAQARYRTAYCGLCRRIDALHGLRGRFTLSYDLTFLDLLLCSLYEGESELSTGCSRCPVHPLHGVNWRSSGPTDYCADLSVALHYYNAEDKWKDDHNLLGLGYEKLLSGCRTDAEARWPRQCAAIRSCLARLAEYEAAGSEDLDAVASAHPGCGYLFDRRQLKDFRDQFADDPAGWRRAFCNLRDTSSTERVYPAALWTETETAPLDLSALDLDTLAFGVAVGMESESTAIAAACRRDGVTVVQIVDVLPGTAGAAERLADLQSRYGGAPIAIDRRGPSAPLADRLHEVAADGTPEYRLSDIGNTEIVAAGVLMLDRLMQRQVLHVPDPALDDAAAVAVRRWVADSWVLSRRNSEQAINALEAAQLAVTASLHAQPAAPLQIFG